MFAARAFCLSAAAQSSPPLLVSRPLQGPGVLTQAGESPCGFMPLKFGLGIYLQIRSLYAVNPPASTSPSQATGIRGTSHHTRLECPLNSGLTQEALTSRFSNPCWLSSPAHRVCDHTVVLVFLASERPVISQSRGRSRSHVI